MHDNHLVMSPESPKDPLSHAFPAFYARPYFMIDRKKAPGVIFAAVLRI